MAVVLRDGISAASSWEERTRIVAAILQGDAENASAEMETHITQARAKAVTQLDRFATG